MRTHIYFLQGELGHTIAVVLFLVVPFIGGLVWLATRSALYTPAIATVSSDSAWEADWAKQRQLLDSLMRSASAQRDSLSQLLQSPSRSRPAKHHGAPQPR